MCQFLDQIGKCSTDSEGKAALINDNLHYDMLPNCANFKPNRKLRTSRDPNHPTF